MATYRELTSGHYELDTPQGPMPVMASEAELRAAGHAPASLLAPGSGALAQNGGASGTPGLFRVADALTMNRSDAVQQIPGLTESLQAYRGPSLDDPRAEQRVGPALDNARGLAALRGAEPGKVLTTAKEFREEEERQKQREESGAGRGSLRDGANVERFESGGRRGGDAQARSGGGGGAGVIPGGDMRVGFSIQKSGLSPEQIQAAESSAADASIDRKLAAREISDNRRSAVETVSAEMGRQIRSEAVALREKQERDRAMRADYETRQRAIDEERRAVEELKVNPETFWEEKGDLARVIGAIAVLAGGFAAGYTGRNLALEAIDRNIEQNITQQKEQIARRREGLQDRETELDRLVRIYGSPQAAEDEFRDRSRAMVQALGQKMTLDSGSRDAEASLRAQFASWDDERAQSRLAREEALAGRVTEQWAYQPPRAFGGRPPVNEADVQKLAKAREEAGIGDAEGGVGEVQDLISNLPEGELPTAASRNVLSRAVRSGADFFAGKGAGAELMDTPAEQKATAQLERVLNKVKAKYLGAARSPQELEDFSKGFERLRTKEDLLQYTREMDRTLVRREAGVKAGFRPEVVETFEARQAGRQPANRPSTLRGE